MEELKDLQKMAAKCEEQFNTYDGIDFMLPDTFKDRVQVINSNKVIYKNYSATIETPSSQYIYIPNQWFYIASCVTDFYNELQKYRKALPSDFPNDRLKELKGNQLTEEESAAIDKIDGLNTTSKGFLKKFITDYSWWRGDKTIDSDDFYVSPILSSAKLVNDLPSFVTDICVFLSDKEDLVKTIIYSQEYADSNQNHNTNIEQIIKLPSEDKDNYSVEELGRILKDISDNLGKGERTSMFTLFGIRYGKYINQNSTQILQAAGLPTTSQGNSISTGKQLYDLISESNLGIRFWSPKMSQYNDSKDDNSNTDMIVLNDTVNTLLSLDKLCEIFSKYKWNDGQQTRYCNLFGFKYFRSIRALANNDNKSNYKAVIDKIIDVRLLNSYDGTNKVSDNKENSHQSIYDGIKGGYNLALLIDDNFDGVSFNTQVNDQKVLEPIEDQDYNIETEEKLDSQDAKKLISDRKLDKYLNAIKAKPFLLLAGISGTGKSRIIRELAFATCPNRLQDLEGAAPGNYCMIEVKPNWHDSTELLGFYSNLSGKYMFKKFTNFLVKAMQYKDVPFFVCLDEMNLAPVEQYFAEFLSVLETRKKTNKGIVSDALVEAKYFSQLNGLCDDAQTETYKKAYALASEIGLSVKNIEVAKYLVENGLTLPDNVIIIGTVNMDDTTHLFSRKVIDRAMTIEMNGGNLMDMFGGEIELEYLEKPLPLSNFKAKYVTADEALRDSELNKCDVESIKKNLVNKLDQVNTCLVNTPFQVSYRVLNELVIYLAVLADTHGTDEIEKLINIAVDDITLMKILPRIEGDEEMFSLPEKEKEKEKADNRLSWLYDIMPNFTKDTEDAPNYDNEDIEGTTKAEEGRSQKKLKEMSDRLSAMSFTRFWP